MKPIEMREADFKKELEAFKYPETVKQEFFDYWTEPNKSGTKMRFELEKTWNISRRLARWVNNGFNNKPGNQANKVLVTAMVKNEPKTEFDRLDVFLGDFISRPSEIPFDAFGQWYDFMREQKLLKKYTPFEVDQLRQWYNGDNQKCRCAVVQQTLTGYVNSGLRIKDIVQLRERLNGV